MASLNNQEGRTNLPSLNIIKEDVLDIVYAYLFLSQKMKLEGLNRYEHEVIVNMNNRLELLGITKVAVQQIIDSINSAYTDHLAGLEQAAEKVLRLKKSTVDELGNTILVDENDGFDAEYELKHKQMIDLAKKVFAQSTTDYLAIMNQWTQKKSYRVVVGINLNSSKFSSASVQDDKSRLKSIKDELESFVTAILGSGIQHVENTPDSIIQFSHKEVGAWDMSLCDACSKGNYEEYKKEFNESLKPLKETPKNPLPFQICFIGQYVEIHPDHVPNNIIIGLLIMQSTISEYLENFPEDENKNDEPKMPHVDMAEKNTLLLKRFLGLFPMGRVTEKPKPKNNIKEIRNAIDVPQHMIDEYNKQIREQTQKNKPSLEQEGLLQLTSYDEGNYVLIYLQDLTKKIS